jgi:hypothetical protein
MKVEGAVFAILGALEAFPRRLAAREIEKRRGSLRRGVSRRTSVVIFGHRAAQIWSADRILKGMHDARSAGAALVSENAFLRLLGVTTKPETPRQISAHQLAEQSGLDSETVGRLCLFDAFEFSEEPFGFRDLVAAKQYARLLADGVDWLGLIRAIRSGRVAAPGGSLASVRLELLGGDVMMRAGQSLTELSGQHLLDFPVEEADRADQLFEGAQEAEEIGDWEHARILYEKCLAIEPRDPVIAFNLSHAFMQLDNASEARRYLHKVLTLDKNYAEAWYNLAALARERSDMAAARRHLQKAIAADPTYPDPLFNLALVEFEAGAHDEASRLWQRYRELDPGSEWSEKAKHGLQLIQLMAQHPGLKVDRPEAPGPLRAAR